MECGIIVLAAGASSRLGRPKQLLFFEGKTLLQHALAQACASVARTIVVVLGADAPLIEAEIKETDAHVVVNENWQEGMAASIQSGLNALVNINPAVEGVILMVCDQPFVTTALLNSLVKVHQDTGSSIVTCSYDNTFGPPTFFHKKLFPELLHLQGDVGARSIIKHHIDDAAVIPFPEGSMDIDTEADYEKISRAQK